MQPFAMRQGQVLIERKALDRTLYLVESGGLTVHYEDARAGCAWRWSRPVRWSAKALFSRGLRATPRCRLPRPANMVPDTHPVHRTQQPQPRRGARDRHGPGLPGGAPPGQQAQANCGHLKRNYFTNAGSRRPSVGLCRETVVAFLRAALHCWGGGTKVLRSHFSRPIRRKPRHVTVQLDVHGSKTGHAAREFRPVAHGPHPAGQALRRQGRRTEQCPTGQPQGRTHGPARTAVCGGP